MCDRVNVITLRQANPDYVILDLCGFISAKHERAFEVIANTLRSRSEKKIVLNFNEVKGIDGTGLKQLLIFCTLMRKLNRKLAAYGVNTDVRQVFQLTRMENLLRTCENEYQAMTG